MRTQLPIRLPGRKWLIGLALAAFLFVCYLLAGYVLAPRLIRAEAARWAAGRPGLTLGLGTIKVDPLHLTLSVRDVALAARGRTLLSLAGLRLAVSPLSLLVRGYRISALDLEKPFVHVVIRADGSVNLAALASPGASAGPAPPVRIDDLRIDQGELIVTDRGRTPAAHVVLVPITLRLGDFRTQGASSGHFALAAHSPDGASLAWQGAVSMSPFEVGGALSLSGLKAGTLAQFLPSNLPVTVTAGTLSASTQYAVGYASRGLDVRLTAFDFSASDLGLHGNGALHGTIHVRDIEANTGELHLSGGEPASGSLAALGLSGVTVTGNGPARDQTVRLGRLSVSNASFDSGKRALSVSSLALTGLRLPVTRDPRGRLSLMRFLAPKAGGPAGQVGGADRAADAWHFALHQLAVTDARLSVQDQEVKPTAHLLVGPFSLRASGVSDDLKRAIPFRLRGRIDRRAFLALTGRIAPGTARGTLRFSLQRLPLRPFAPYLPAPSLELTSGVLATSGFAALAGGKPTRLTAVAQVSDLQVLDRASGGPLLGWRKLQLAGIDYRPGRLEIARARLAAPVGLITILPNRTLNLVALAPTHAAPGGPPSARHPTQEAAQAFAVRVRRLDIDDGSIVFADESIEPHFRAPIDALHGTIRNLATSPDAIAAVELAGQVIDQYSPVSVRGKLNLYGLGRDTNIRVAFDNIELPIFNPYSNFYAGYAIAEGKLSTRFHYRIVDRRLDADHHITVDQLQWGGPSGSKARVGWPIRLATALLKDRNGVIRINLPVTGSLDDPSFHIASIVWMMLGHLLEKVALAPFSLIGKLFAGAQKAQYIDFAPGSAALSPAAAAGLGALARALAERPALRVEIPAGPAGREDALALEDARIDALLLARARGTHPPSFQSLSVREQLRGLAALYRARLRQRPVYPAPTPSIAGKAPAKPGTPPPDRKRERDLAEIAWLRDALRETVRPSSGALAKLGLARAEHVQGALLTHGALDPKRVFLTTGESGTPSQGRVRVQLQLR